MISWVLDAGLSNSSIFEIDNKDSIKTLMLYWHPNKDGFGFNLKFSLNPIFTKRSILSVCGEDNKYATLIFIINNARIGYIKMYSVYSERQTDCECVKSLAPRSSYRHMQAYKVVAE